MKDALGMREIFVDDGRTSRAKIRHPSRQVPLTFDSEFARQRPLLEFVTSQHVLAAAAADYWKTIDSVPALRTHVIGPKQETGDGFFFVFALDERGMTRNLTLHPIVVLSDGRIARETAQTLLKQLQEACDQRVSIPHNRDDYEQARQIAEEYIVKLRDTIRDESSLRNDAILRSRSAAINASFDAKIKRTQEMLDMTTEARIRRMREGQLRNLEDRRHAKLKELDAGNTVVVSYSLIATGQVRIQPGVIPRAEVADFEPVVVESVAEEPHATAVTDNDIIVEQDFVDDKPAQPVKGKKDDPTQERTGTKASSKKRLGRQLFDRWFKKR